MLIDEGIADALRHYTLAKSMRFYDSYGLGFNLGNTEMFASYSNRFTFLLCIQTHFSGLCEDFLTRRFTDVQ